MEKSKVVLASAVSVLAVGGVIFAIVNKNKNKVEGTFSIASDEQDEIDEEAAVLDEDELDFDFEGIEGTYEGSAKYSNAVFRINDDLRSASVLVTFRGSKTSSNFTRWSMTIRPDLDWLRANESSDIFRLSYSDCSKEEVKLDNSGKEIVTQKVYSDGKGYFDLDDNRMIWHDNIFEEGDTLKDCEFTKK